MGPNILGAVTRATATGNALRDMQREKQKTDLFAQHGAGIMAGDQSAMNAYAAFDPQAAMAARGENRRLDLLNAQEQRAIQAHAAKMSAAERKERSDRIGQGLLQAASLYAKGDLQGLNMMLAGVGEAPLESLDQFNAVAMKYKGVMDALKGYNDLTAAPKPADEYGRYAQEEMAAGREPLSRIDYAQAKKGKGTIVFDSVTGKPLVSIGGSGVDPTDPTSPSSPAAMIASIDGILSDPALNTSTGLLSWTQAIPGTDAKRFGARAKQLEGQAFLQAFESLKGGGHITEIEGRKATEAIGRLDTSQRAEDYRAALQELRDTLELGLYRKTQGITVPAQEPAAPPAAPDFSAMSDDELQAYIEEMSKQ